MPRRFQSVPGRLSIFAVCFAALSAADAFGQEVAEPTAPAPQAAQSQIEKPEPTQSFQPFASALRYISQSSASLESSGESSGSQSALQDKVLKLAVDAGVNWLMNNAATLFAETASDKLSDQVDQPAGEPVASAPRNNVELLSENQSPVFSQNRMTLLSGNRLEVRVITQVEATRRPHRHEAAKVGRGSVSIGWIATAMVRSSFDEYRFSRKPTEE